MGIGRDSFFGLVLTQKNCLYQCPNDVSAQLWAYSGPRQGQVIIKHSFGQVKLGQLRILIVPILFTISAPKIWSYVHMCIGCQSKRLLAVAPIHGAPWPIYGCALPPRLVLALTANDLYGENSISMEKTRSLSARTISYQIPQILLGYG